MPRRYITGALDRYSITISAAAMVLLIALATAILMGITNQFDNDVRTLVHNTSSDTLTRIAVSFSYFGSLRFIIPLSVASIGGLLVFKMRSSALGLGASIAGALVLNWALKHAFHRARPVPFFVVDPESFSFPSGHVFFALCFYLAFLLIFRGHRWAAAPIALLATFLVIGIGWSRIYLGVHYPTDVIGGCLAGIFWLGTLRGCGFFA